MCYYVELTITMRAISKHSGAAADSEDGAVKPERSALPWLLALLFAAGMLGLFWRQRDERAAMRRALGQARDEAAELRQRLFRTEDELGKLDVAHQAQAKTTQTLANEVASRDAEKEANLKVIADLRAKLDAKEGDVTADSGRITVNLVDQILFKSGDANLSPEGKQVLAHVGGVLKGLKDKQILIGGHTDDRPIHTQAFPSNWELSAARAVNVARYLGETVGVDPARLTAAGFSQFHPRGTDKAKNRRIEILLTPIVAVQK